MESSTYSTLDIEDESILSNIFKDSFPESWRENPDFAQYLSELSSFGVTRLGREPDRLADERAQILEQTQDLAFHNYKTFIQTAECSREIFQDFQVIEQHVESMLTKLPELTKECNSFTKKAQEVNTNRRMNSLTLQRHTQLLEILEMPQLMDTYVRNGYYEEALELATHVKRLEKKHSNIPVLVTIVNEVKNSTQLMLTQLIQQLRTNIQLPACLRVIGYLRRMGVFTEAELRIKFLQARDAWFQSILLGIPTDDPYHHITKTIEVSRVHLFDIITQYRAIFSDEDPLLSTTKEDGPNEAALFHGWVVQKVSQFLQILESDLQRGIGGRLDSLLGQCMYFGLSFSRVGADFRGLLAPIFQKAALAGLEENLQSANQKFDDSMQSFTLIGAPSVIPSSGFGLGSQGSAQLHPPTALLEYSPVAAYCNQILSSFNDLRLCAPLSLASDVATIVQDSLSKAVETILAYHRAEETTFNDTEREKFLQFCSSFALQLLPYLNRCLQVLFPPSQIAQLLGVTLADLNKLGNLGSINVEKLTKPMDHLLPVKIEEVEPVPSVSTENAQEEPTVEETEIGEGTSGVSDNREDTSVRDTENNIEQDISDTSDILKRSFSINEEETELGADEKEEEISEEHLKSGDSE